MESKEDIEQLFKNTFDNFESDVHPDAWVNIQNGLNVPPVSNPGSGANNVASGAKLTAVSSKFIIMAVTAIVGITATLVYFSSDNETAKANSSNETKISQSTLPDASTLNVENKNFSETSSAKKEAKSASSNETVISKNYNQPPSGETTSYLSSANEDVAVAEMKKKNATEVSEEKNKVAEVKLQSKPDQATTSVNDEKKAKENNLHDDASSDQTAEDGSDIAAPEVKTEKSIEEYLGKIPNVITPNGDGVNDAFVIEGKDIQTLKVSIIDRSGKIIHHWNNLHGFWDGKLENGDPAKTGTYFYDIFAQTTSGSPVIKKGTIHLLLK